MKKDPFFQPAGSPDVQNGPARPGRLSETVQVDPPGSGPLTVSLIIPNRNGVTTISRCLESALQALGEHDEIIVVDDCSTDGSVVLARRYPCNLVRLDRHSGASRARNIGALRSRGDILFFIDADCLLQHDALERVRLALAEAGPGTVIGGTYTQNPVDRDFFSRFQSVFIHHAETRHAPDADYIAGHAMAVHRPTFLRSGGFPEVFLPIIEDVELSHRLRGNGCRLIMVPGIQVRHCFRFSLRRSLVNAMRKTRYWTRYSLWKRDILADSGTASLGLKIAVICWAVSAAAIGSLYRADPAALAIVPVLAGASSIANRDLLRAFWRFGGAWFGVRAAVYYLLVYPAAVALGAGIGLVEHLFGRDRCPAMVRPGATRESRRVRQGTGC